MTRTSLSAVGLAAAWLLTDLWRLWTPSLITLFGRAAQTPTEVMGAYALAVMAAPLVLIAFVRGPAPRLAAGLLVAAFVVRVGVQVVPGGGAVQLYGSSLGVALAVAALCLATGALGRRLVPGVFLGVAVATAVHAALGSFGAVWRDDAASYAVLVLQAIAVGFAVRAAGRGGEEPGGPAVAPRSAFLLLPLLLLILLALANVGRASVADSLWGPVVAVLGSGTAAVVALLPAPRRRPWAAAVLFPAAVALSLLPEVVRDGAEGALPVWFLAAVLVGPAAAVRLLLFAGRGRSSRRTALAAGAGAIVWIALFFAYYAGYDLGYRADLPLVGAAVLFALWTVAYRAGGADDDEDFRVSERRIDDSGARAVAGVAVATVAAAAAALVGPPLTVPSLPVAREAAASDELVVAAYNLRMGYGIDGVFRPADVAAQIRDSGAQVVLLSEVDRGWLLNGGQDQLAILARMLGMHAVFGPAADPVWGDAILTSLPTTEASSAKYPMFDALTGAAITSASVTWEGEKVRILATHLQPDANATDATGRQAAILADAFRDAPGAVIGGGDLNTTPVSDAWRTLLRSGAKDALEGIRPAPTSPADDPDEEIDHLLVSGLRPVHAEVVRSELSDHRMIIAAFR
ncbi:endonuclease/exonuclease/phosphatase family protein [Patulibacter defluvii]|uniref:endonuclease/exonuclease/phosphatase family protein n=1 Tax=Patulibacter defluvii TaxID=3095358 RepID=UPI002A75A2F0|nr:endonuclease/exonuclease/phosphatase family protein [Patulibacter sp. DM4]